MKNTTKTKTSKSEAEHLVKLLEKELQTKEDPLMDKIIKAEHKCIEFIIDQDVADMKDFLEEMSGLLSQIKGSSPLIKELKTINKFFETLVPLQDKLAKAWEEHMLANGVIPSRSIN